MSKSKNEIDLLCYLTLRSTDFLVYSAADPGDSHTTMLHYKSRSACWEIIHVRNILAELWSLTLRI